MKIEFDTKTIPNFLTDEEIDELEQIWADDAVHVITDEGPDKHALHNSNYVFLTSPKSIDRVSEIIDTKIKEHFHPDIIVGDWHLLDSLKPYPLHGDAYDEKEKATYLPAGVDYAWTFIIPLDTYDANTVIFNEKSPDLKNMEDWINLKNPPKKHSITDEVYNEYLTHCDRMTCEHLSIEEIFPWNKGSINGTDRRRIHCSDDYISTGLTGKRALVAWSTIPSKYTEEIA
jgi:hypothetical protein